MICKRNQNQSIFSHPSNRWKAAISLSYQLSKQFLHIHQEFLLWSPQSMFHFGYQLNLLFGHNGNSKFYKCFFMHINLIISFQGYMCFRVLSKFSNEFENSLSTIFLSFGWRRRKHFSNGQPPASFRLF